MREITPNEVKDPTQLQRYLRDVASKLGELSNRVATTPPVEFIPIPPQPQPQPLLPLITYHLVTQLGVSGIYPTLQLFMNVFIRITKLQLGCRFSREVLRCRHFQAL